MAEERPDDQQAPARRYRWAFSYRLDGDLRFISHHDTLRLFRRALARADLPVRFSEGFNPHPRLVIPLPRPVGIASDAEVIVVEFTESVDAETARRQLDEQVPAGMEVTRARLLADGENVVPEQVLYRLEMPGARPDDLNRRIKDILSAPAIIVTRTNHKNGTKREVNIRPFIESIEPRRDAVAFCLNVTGGGSARPSEIAALVRGKTEPANHLIRRTGVSWRRSR